jgi:hypothetical protein
VIDAAPTSVGVRAVPARIKSGMAEDRILRVNPHQIRAATIASRAVGRRMG